MTNWPGDVVISRKDEGAEVACTRAKAVHWLQGLGA